MNGIAQGIEEYPQAYAYSCAMKAFLFYLHLSTSGAQLVSGSLKQVK